jgi:hypothetical protein
MLPPLKHYDLGIGIQPSDPGRRRGPSCHTAYNNDSSFHEMISFLHRTLPDITAKNVPDIFPFFFLPGIAAAQLETFIFGQTIVLIG